MRKQLLNCDYDLLSENNLLNQIIKTTIVLLIRLAAAAALFIKVRRVIFSAIILPSSKSVFLCF